MLHPKAWLSEGYYLMEALRLRIPERHQAGLAKLISLPDNALEELLSVLNEIPQSLYLDSIIAYIFSKIPTIPERDVREVVSTLDSLYYIYNESDLSLQDFSDEVLRAMNATGNKELQIESSLRERFKDRLIRSMSGKLLNTVIKSRDALYEQERTFGSARVLSDIRSVFVDNTEHNPDAAIIVHTLKIHYYESTQHKEFFISLDGGDITLLIDELIRAKEKAETLKSILAAANVPYIDAE